jgi:hypothetical protein
MSELEDILKTDSMQSFHFAQQEKETQFTELPNVTQGMIHHL